MSASLNGVIFAVIPEWVIYADIGPNAVRLYGVLYRHLGENEFAWPSRETLADKMHCAQATVDAAIKELAGIGAVTKERRTNGSGHRISSAYYLRTLQKLEGAQNQFLGSGGSESGQERETVKESQSSEGSKDDDSYPAEFEALWKLYPRHESKNAAWRKVKALVRKDVHYEDLMNAVVNYAVSVKDRETKHIKLGSTFFGPDWREWVGAVVVRPVVEEPDPIAEAARRHAQSVPAPPGFADNLRANKKGT